MKGERAYTTKFSAKKIKKIKQTNYEKYITNLTQHLTCNFLEYFFVNYL